MDSLFGIPLTSILVALLLALGAIFAVLGVIAWRQPLLVRMGLRNIGRRKPQTALIVIGLMLSTLIISAAFATGDTVGYSITNEVYDSFEEADILIAFDNDISEFGDRFLTDEFLDAFTAEFSDDPDIDGITGVLNEVLPVLNLDERLSEANASLIGVDPATADPFKGLKTLDGELIPGSTLGGLRAYVSEDLADAINVGRGDTVHVFQDGAPTEFEVIDVVQNTSITQAQGGAGGLVVSLDVARELTGNEGSLTAIVVSITGGVRDTLDLNDEVADRVDDFIAANPESQAGIFLTKKEAVALAELIGSIFVTFFLIFGLFAIASGILLIFLIFVMLAAERRSEMGMARAVGMQRLHLTESFLAEGMAYNVGSAAVGALLGLAVAFLLVLAIRLLALAPRNRNVRLIGLLALSTVCTVVSARHSYMAVLPAGFAVDLGPLIIPMNFARNLGSGLVMVLCHSIFRDGSRLPPPLLAVWAVQMSLEEPLEWMAPSAWELAQPHATFVLYEVVPSALQIVMLGFALAWALRESDAEDGGRCHLRQRRRKARKRGCEYQRAAHERDEAAGRHVERGEAKGVGPQHAPAQRDRADG